MKKVLLILVLALIMASTAVLTVVGTNYDICPFCGMMFGYGEEREAFCPQCGEQLVSGDVSREPEPDFFEMFSRKEIIVCTTIISLLLAILVAIVVIAIIKNKEEEVANNTNACESKQQ